MPGSDSVVGERGRGVVVLSGRGIRSREEGFFGFLVRWKMLKGGKQHRRN